MSRAVLWARWAAFVGGSLVGFGGVVVVVCVR